MIFHCDSINQCCKKFSKKGIRRPCCFGHLQKLLQYTSDILNKYEARYWIDYATCLSSYRHNTILPWDYDVDFSVSMETARKMISVSEEVRDDGFYLFYRYHGEPLRTMRTGRPDERDIEVVKIFLEPNTLLHSDMYVFREQDDFIERVSDTLPGPKRILAKLFGETEKALLHDCVVRHPSQVKQYLTLIYGEDFMSIPDHRKEDFENWRLRDQS